MSVCVLSARGDQSILSLCGSFRIVFEKVTISPPGLPASMVAEFVNQTSLPSAPASKSLVVRVMTIPCLIRDASPERGSAAARQSSKFIGLRGSTTSFRMGLPAPACLSPVTSTPSAPVLFHGPDDLFPTPRFYKYQEMRRVARLLSTPDSPHRAAGEIRHIV